MGIIHTSRETTREPKNHNRQNSEEARLEGMLRIFIRWIEQAETAEDYEAFFYLMKQLVKPRRKEDLSVEARFIMRKYQDEFEGGLV